MFTYKLITMSFGGFGTSTPAASSAFSFGAGAATTATPIKPGKIKERFCRLGGVLTKVVY